MPEDPDRADPVLGPALDYLASFTDYEQLRVQTPARTTFDLGRLTRLLARLGSPEAEDRPVVHVTGTKGKSSTVWMTDALLRAHGLRTFRFISPHVSSVRERLAIDGEPVTASRFAALVDRLRPAVEALRREAPEDLPSFFEAMTVMGFLLAREERVDATVLEVGLGGRLDATNVCRPTVCVLTGVALDHTRILGDTVEAIAAEKAGILKPGVPAVLGFGPNHPAFPVVAARAAELDCPLVRPGAGLALLRSELEIATDGFPRLRVDGDLDGFPVHDLVVRAGAPVQGLNVLVALEAARRVLQRADRLLDEASVRAAMAGLELPGRAELHPGRPPLLLDGAHTRESVEALVPLVRRLGRDRRVVLVCGLTRDREPGPVLGPLLGEVAGVVATTIPTPRALEAEVLVRDLAARGVAVEAVASPGEALAAACSRAGEDGLVVVAGSLYLVGAVRSAAAGGRPGSGTGLPSPDARRIGSAGARDAEPPAGHG